MGWPFNIILPNNLKQDRKYFDSGDYALSKAGVAPQSNVGTAIPSPEKYDFSKLNYLCLTPSKVYPTHLLRLQTTRTSALRQVGPLAARCMALVQPATALWLLTLR